MQAVTFQEPGEVQVDDRPEPELLGPTTRSCASRPPASAAPTSTSTTAACRSSPGFTLGHEFVGTVLAAGDEVTQVGEGDRVLGCYCTACGNCFFCRRGVFHKCDDGRVFGHGKTLGSLQGAQAEQVLVPHANLTLRRVPEGMSDDVALFAGDVMGTGYHAVDQTKIRPGDTVAVLGLGPVGLCAVQAARAAGASRVVAIDSVEERLEMAESFGAEAIHLTEGDPRAAVKTATEGRGVDGAIDAVGHPDALELACRITRKAGTVSAIGVYAERIEVHMGIVWIKALTLKTGHANVIGHVDRVLCNARRRRARPRPARYAPHEARGRGRGVRGLRPPRGPQDRDEAMSVERGTAALLTRRREILAQGAEPLGWKIGFNVPATQKRLGIDAPLAGFLTTDSLIEDSWNEYPVIVESEVALEIGADGRSIAALLPALEIADEPDLDLEIEQILAGNIFHRAVAFGPRVETQEPGAARILVNGEEQHTVPAEETGERLEAMIEAVAARLADAGEELRAGDLIITGIIAPPHKAEPGDTVRLELEALGGVELRFT